MWTPGDTLSGSRFGPSPPLVSAVLRAIVTAIWEGLLSFCAIILMTRMAISMYKNHGMLFVLEESHLHEVDAEEASQIYHSA